MPGDGLGGNLHDFVRGQRDAIYKDYQGSYEQVSVICQSIIIIFLSFSKH